MRTMDWIQITLFAQVRWGSLAFVCEREMALLDRVGVRSLTRELVLLDSNPECLCEQGVSIARPTRPKC